MGGWWVVRRGAAATLGMWACLGLGGKALAQLDGGGQPAFAMGAGRGVQGTVTAVTADRLTLRTERGEVYQVALSPNTRINKDRSSIRLAEVHAGDGVGAMGELDVPNKTVHALFLMVIDAEQLKKAREALGKTWISGTVKSIEDTRITILRPDQISQVISVDEDTSFRRGGRMQMQMGEGGGRASGPRASVTPDGGESVTLADVKIGYLVAGPGTLKNGVFVPTTLGISDPATERGRRRQGGGAGTSVPASPAEPKPR